MSFDAKERCAAGGGVRPRDPDIVTAEDLAEVLGCTVETVNEKAAAGDLPGIKYGRRWVFPRPALMQRLTEKAIEDAARRREPAKPAAVVHGPHRRGNIPPKLPKLTRTSRAREEER